MHLLTPSVRGSKNDAARLCRMLLVRRVLIEDTFRRDNEYASVASRVLVDERAAARLFARTMRIELPFALSAKAARQRDGPAAAPRERGSSALDLRETGPGEGEAVPGQVIEIEDDDDAEELDPVRAAGAYIHDCACDRKALIFSFVRLPHDLAAVQGNVAWPLHELMTSSLVHGHASSVSMLGYMSLLQNHACMIEASCMVCCGTTEIAQLLGPPVLPAGGAYHTAGSTQGHAAAEPGAGATQRPAPRHPGAHRG